MIFSLFSEVIICFILPLYKAQLFLAVNRIPLSVFSIYIFSLSYFWLKYTVLENITRRTNKHTKLINEIKMSFNLLFFLFFCSIAGAIGGSMFANHAANQLLGNRASTEEEFVGAVEGELQSKILEWIYRFVRWLV